MTPKKKPKKSQKILKKFKILAKNPQKTIKKTLENHHKSKKIKN
jgi:hypothetical protein